MKHSPSRCRDLLGRLSLYIDGDLNARQRRALMAHLRRCPCCEEFAESLKRTVQLCQQAGRRRLPADVRARARARIAELLSDEEGDAGRP
jgi:anti-sigma factor RsiW